MTWQPDGSYSAGPAVSLRRPGRPVRVVGWTLLLVTLIVGIICIVGLVRGVGRAVTSTLNSDIYATPTQVVVQLDAGSNLIYSRDATTVHNGPTGNAFARVITSQRTELEVHNVTTSTTITRNNATYTAVARFDVPVAGRYGIQANGTDAGDQIFVAGDLTNSLEHSIGWLIGVAVCGFFFLAAVVVIIIGYARFKKPKPPAAAAGWGQGGPGGYQQGGVSQGGFGQGDVPGQGGYQAGWYPDPQDARYVRYYDGTQWTGHVQPRQ